MIRLLDEDGGSGPPAIELTPIIDMVFLLLIFFLAATTFREAERELDVLLPQASAAAPISMALREIVVHVDASGGLRAGGRIVTPEDLRSMLEDAIAANPEQKVSVRADRRASWDEVVRALDACKAAGVTEPWLDTVAGGG